MIKQENVVRDEQRSGYVTDGVFINDWELSKMLVFRNMPKLLMGWIEALVRQKKSKVEHD